MPIPEYGPVMLDIAGLTLSKTDCEKIKHPNTGGLILFARNYQSPEQLIELVNAIRSVRPEGILIAVDQEGGRVQRFKTGFTPLPPASCYAENNSALQLAETAGWLMATEILATGIDFSFAPVLDVDCGISKVIGDRSFAQDTQLSAQLASQFRKGMRLAGMSAVGKHFPGHGAVSLDSHLSLPVDERALQAILEKDILPFKHLIDQGIEGIMPAHIIYADCDAQPAGFSEFWIQNILRQKLRFTGAVFSDDLSMEGASIAGDFVQRSELALSAGCDMVLVCNNELAAEQVLDTLPIKNSIPRNQRLHNMTGKYSDNFSSLPNDPQWRKNSALIAGLS